MFKPSSFTAVQNSLQLKMLQHGGALGDAHVGWPRLSMPLRSDRRPCWFTLSKLGKFQQLRSVPIAAAAKLIARFGPINGGRVCMAASEIAPELTGHGLPGQSLTRHDRMGF